MSIVFHLTAQGGFFSAFFFLCEAYLFAKRQNIPFYVDSSRWIYGRWYDFFRTLNEWNGKETPGTLHCAHNDLYALGITFKNEGDCAFICLNTLQDYIDVVEELYVLKDDLQQDIDACVRKMGAFKALFVRRGDKITSGETAINTTKDILGQMGPSLRASDILFVQTDDYTVVEEIFAVHSNTVSLVSPTQRGSFHDDFMQWSDQARKAHTRAMLVGLGICDGATECWTDEASNVGRFLKVRHFDTTFLYSTDCTEITQSTDALTPCPAYRAVFKKYKDNMFYFPYRKRDGTDVLISHRFFREKPPVGFILLRHMNSPQSMDYWHSAYLSIRKYHPTEPIVIIDDHSHPACILHPLTQKRQAELKDAVILYSDKPFRGELVAYAYYVEFGFFNKAVIMHDSVFLQKAIPHEQVDALKFLWHFEHTWDDAEKETGFMQLLNNHAEMRAMHAAKESWWGCFGVMSILTYSSVVEMELNSDFFRSDLFLRQFQTREDRMVAERLFAILATATFPELKTRPSLFGRIHDYYAGVCAQPCSYTYQDYVENPDRVKDLPIIKVFTGR